MAIDYDIALVRDSRDVVLIAQPYCETCATRKLGILKIFPIARLDAQELIAKYQTKSYRVKCECVRVVVLKKLYMGRSYIISSEEAREGTACLLGLFIF